MRILVVEDEKNLNRIITEAMEDEGYSVDSCFNGADALDYALTAVYDVVILDIMLPKMDGLELVRRLRRSGNHTPVLFLTARDSVADRVEGLESGGDYYLTKPFDFQELIAVVHVMTRKYTGNRSNVYNVGDLTIDTSARNRGVVLSREMIENNLWNYEYEGGTNVVDVYVGYLRKKMDTGFSKKLIHTVWGTGWVLREE